MKVRYTQQDDKILHQLCEEGKKQKEIASALGRTVPSVKYRLRFWRWVVENFGSLSRYNNRHCEVTA